MEDRLENVLGMLKTKQKICELYPDIIRKVTGFPIMVQKLKTRITTIDIVTQQLDVKITGIATEKNEMKSFIAKGMDALSSAVAAYAHSISNHKLEESMLFTEKKLFRMRDDVLFTTSMTIYQTAFDLKTQLADYGITTEVLDNSLAFITSYGEGTHNPKIAIVDKKGKREALKQLIKETADFVKNEMDRTAKIFKMSDMEFYEKYLNSGRVIKTGHKRLVTDDVEKTTGSVDLKVLDKETQEPVMDAIYEIKSLNIADATDEDGEGYIDSLLPAPYILTVTSNVHEPQDVAIVIVAGQSLSLVVELVKVPETV